MRFAFLKGTLGSGSTKRSEGHSGVGSSWPGIHFIVTRRVSTWPHVWQHHSGDGRDKGSCVYPKFLSATHVEAQDWVRTCSTARNDRPRRAVVT